MHPNIYRSICVCVSVLHAYTYILHFICKCENRSGLCMRAPVCDGDGSAVCARVGGLVLRARPEPETVNRASPAHRRRRRCGFGAQAFSAASAFNANIGAWNTAAVTTLSYVCAAPGPAARTMADALGRASMRRGRLCAVAPPMRARVRTRGGTRLRGALGVGTAARRGGSIHASQYTYIYMCVSVCVTRLHIHSPFYLYR